MKLALTTLVAVTLAASATAQQGFTLIEVPIGAKPHSIAVSNLDHVGWKDLLIRTASPWGLFHLPLLGPSVPALGYFGPDGGDPPPSDPEDPPVTHEIECDGGRILVMRGEDGNLLYFYPIEYVWGGGVTYLAQGGQPWHVFDQYDQPFVIGANDEWFFMDTIEGGSVDVLVVIKQSGEVLQFGNLCGVFKLNQIPSGNIIFGKIKIVGGNDDDHGLGDSKKKKLWTFESSPTQFGVFITDLLSSGSIGVTSTTSLPFPVGAGVNRNSVAVLASQATPQLAVLDLQQAGGPVATYVTLPYVATAVAVADLNSDGVLDAVVANKTSDLVGVKLGIEPSGPSMPFVSLGSASGPNALLATDLDDDGDVDLVTSNSATDSATIWIQGSFPTISGVSNFGNGTPGCSGIEALSLSAAPKIGTTFNAVGARAPLNSTGLLLFGTAPDVLGSDPFGIGAVFHIDFLSSVELLSFTVASDALGNTQLPLTLPSSPSLVGASFYGQLLWVWPSSDCGLIPITLGALPLSTSRGLQLTIQP